jgi:isochorismate pyruvate lyase
MKLPDKCKSIEEIRGVIDNIDREIIDLLGRRYAYVKEIIRFKEPTEESIVARERFDAVLSSRRELAEEAGLDPDIIEKIYRDLLTHFINEELKMIRNK